LGEILANVDGGDVRLQLGMPGTRLTRANEGATERYTVLHSLTQAGGTSERAGSLAHELTHVAAGEAFGNVPLFLLVAPTTPQEQIVALANTRRDRVRALQALAAR